MDKNKVEKLLNRLLLLSNISDGDEKTIQLEIEKCIKLEFPSNIEKGDLASTDKKKKKNAEKFLEQNNIDPLLYNEIEKLPKIDDDGKIKVDKNSNEYKSFIEEIKGKVKDKIDNIKSTIEELSNMEDKSKDISTKNESLVIEKEVKINSEKILDLLKEKSKNLLKNIGKKFLLGTLDIFYVIKDSSVPLKEKLFAVSCLCYVITPIDALNDFLPAGYTDDILLIQYTLGFLKTYISPEIKKKSEQTYLSWFDNIDECEKIHQELLNETKNNNQLTDYLQDKLVLERFYPQNILISKQFEDLNLAAFIKSRIEVED